MTLCLQLKFIVSKIILNNLGKLFDYNFKNLPWKLMLGNRKKEERVCTILLHVIRKSLALRDKILLLLYHLCNHHGHLFINT